MLPTDHALPEAYVESIVVFQATIDVIDNKITNVKMMNHLNDKPQQRAATDQVVEKTNPSARTSQPASQPTTARQE